MNVRLNKNQRIQVVTARDIYAIMQQVLLRENKIRRNQEHFWVVGLDNQQKILFIELVALGAVNRVNANPPDVFRMGIYKLAVSIILVHNHPSGNLTPSTSDKQFTDKMLKVSELVNIKIVDHLIISETGFNPQFGARPIKRAIQKLLLNKLSKELLGGNINPDDPILIDCFDKEMVFRKQEINID